jgi:capsular polysaccharide biosynthesis protein
VSVCAQIQVVDADYLTLPQQASLMSNSTVVFSPHGAALTNVVFMPMGAGVIEWHPYNNVKHHFVVRQPASAALMPSCTAPPMHLQFSTVLAFSIALM